jgi:hypothetical protein
MLSVPTACPHDDQFDGDRRAPKAKISRSNRVGSDNLFEQLHRAISFQKMAGITPGKQHDRFWAAMRSVDYPRPGRCIAYT